MTTCMCAFIIIRFSQYVRGSLVGSGGGGTKSSALTLYTKLKYSLVGELKQSITSAPVLPERT